MQNGNTGGNFQQTLDRAAETSLKAQETAQNVGLAVGQVGVGVTAAAIACLFRIGKGVLQGGVQGGRVGVGQFVEATRETLVVAKATVQSGTMACGHCGTGLAAGARFCGHCGTAQEKTD